MPTFYQITLASMGQGHKLPADVAKARARTATTPLEISGLLKHSDNEVFDILFDRAEEFEDATIRELAGDIRTAKEARRRLGNILVVRTHGGSAIKR